MENARRILAFLLFSFACAAAAQVVGRVQFASGDVVAERGGQRLTLATGSEVQPGDVLVAGADGHLQVRMVDAAHISLRPRSRLRIDTYDHDPTRRGTAAALLTLLGGTMRAFTGDIAEQRRDRFIMKTPLASVGIRGSGNILAHLEETGTINHTLTGAHSVTSIVDGLERTLVSYPGQTVQVRPGLPPRYIPTPPLIMAAAAPASRAASASSASSPESAASPAAPAAAAASSGTAGTATEPAASGGTTSGGTASSASTDPAAASSSGSSVAASSPPPVDPSPVTPSPAGGVVAGPSGDGATSTVGTGAPSSSSQATTATVGAAIGAAQAADLPYETTLRFFRPHPSGGYEGVLGSASSSTGGGVVFDASGRLVQVADALVGTFLAGPGAVPPGYAPANFAGTVTFSGGEHRDAFRSPDSSVILGRWSGGSVIVTDDAGARTTFDLGPRSVSYDITSPTPSAVIGAFTGTATYTLAAATAPTDAAGNTGTLTNATVNANFGNRTLAASLGLNVNGASYALSGTSDLAPGNPRFTLASSLQNLNVACSGNCAAAPYLGTVNGLFAGGAGQWIGMSYRINPDRVPGSAYSDFVVGSLALTAGTPPVMGAAPRRGR